MLKTRDERGGGLPKGAGVGCLAGFVVRDRALQKRGTGPRVRGTGRRLGNPGRVLGAHCRVLAAIKANVCYISNGATWKIGSGSGGGLPGFQY